MVTPLASRFAVLPIDDDGDTSKRIKAKNLNKKKEEQPKAQTISSKKPEVKKKNTGTKKKTEQSRVALLYFRVLPLHFSKHKNSTKTNITKLKLNSLLKKHSKLVFILDHIPPPKMRVPPAIRRAWLLPRADVDERKTSLEIVPISKISNSRGADQI
ncbi:hypothetical protein J6590_057205 [Homalodisca vitripennis]|nr:hypothetical protein J6590_057205 [Homalodisca vitripennis]